jgi:hypothetical protein
MSEHFIGKIGDVDFGRSEEMREAKKALRSIVLFCTY